MSDNGSWTGIIGQGSSGIADVGASSFFVMKEGSEVVAFTRAVGFLR